MNNRLTRVLMGLTLFFAMAGAYMPMHAQVDTHHHHHHHRHHRHRHHRHDHR